LQKGDTFGEFTLFNQLPRTHNAEALGDTQILQMSDKQFHQCCAKYPALQQFIIRSMGLKLHIVLERLDDLQRLPTYVRLAKILQLHADENSKVNLKQKELADLLGVTLLSCHKALQKLKELDLIEKSYGGVLIKDANKFTHWLHQVSSLQQIQFNT
jgi:CRP/FNR family transcriptional regulator, cyclic AMP receptor protein